MAIDQTLLLSVAPTFASKWLVPRLGRLRAAHPDLKIRIDPSPGVLDLKSSDIDLAIRLGSGDWRDGTPECLLPQKMFPVCTRAFAERLRGPADIFNQPIICYENPMFSWDDWQAATGLAGPLPFDGPTFSDPWLGLEATISGQGIMLAWDLFVEDALADGRLVAPFPTRVPSSDRLLAGLAEKSQTNAANAAFPDTGSEAKLHRSNATRTSSDALNCLIC